MNPNLAYGTSGCEVLITGGRKILIGDVDVNCTGNAAVVVRVAIQKFWPLCTMPQCFS